MKIFTIEENDANQRLDKFLKKLFPRATRSLIYKLNRKSKIKVLSVWAEGFKKQDNEYKLQVWEQIKIFLSDKDFLELSQKEAPKTLDENKKFDKKNVVYEDGDLLVVNKDAGMNVHPWDYKTKEIDLITQVQDYLWEKLQSLTFKPSLIHRIDRDTSWLVLIAKKKNILQKLSSDFRSHKNITKTYYALVLGKLSRQEWTIKKSLKRIENAQNENKVQVSWSGKEAISHYKVLATHELKTKEDTLYISELEVQIETGRMHQIRVHLASLWNPIIWDNNYGDKKLNIFFKNNYDISRQMLHAWKIDFFHPTRNKKIHLQAKLKDDMEKFLKRVGT